MKKILIVLTILPLLFISGTAFAQTNSSKNQTTILPSVEVVNKDYFAGNGNVEVSGTVNGDIYVFGGTVLVDGTVNGDLIAAGGTVNVTGQVSQNVRVAGGQVIISGKVGRNLSVAGGNIDVASSADIGGSVAIAGGNINLNSPVKLGAKIAGGNVTISNAVGGDLESYSGQTRLTSKSSVGGNFTYWSNTDASVDSGAKVVGKITKNAPLARPPAPAKVLRIITGAALFFKIVSLISTFILGLLFINFLPAYTKKTLETLRAKIWPSLGIGFAALFLAPILAVILFITVVGIPLGLILLPLYLIALYLSRLVVVMWAGQEIFRQTQNKTNDVLALIAGLIVYEILTLIPIVGGFLTFFVILFGLGAGLIALKDSTPVPVKATSSK